jgi:PAS domain S-box-containing protein
MPSEPHGEVEKLQRRLDEQTGEIERLRRRLRGAAAARDHADRLLQTLVDSLPFDFFLIDRSGRYVMQNAKICELYGDLLGKRPEDMAPNEETRRLWLRNNARAFGGETVREEVQASYGGDPLHLFNIISPVREEGEITAILGVNIDITDRKRAEQEKRRIEALYYQAQKLEAVATLAGGTAHNFNNILMAIQGHVSVMLQAPPGSGPDPQALNEIAKQIRNGAQLTSQMLGYARRGSVEVRTVDLNTLVRRTVGTVAQTRREVEATLDLVDHPLTVKGDEGQLEQVLMNILVNAVDAMPGGGELSVSTAQTSDQEMVGQVHAPAPGDYATVAIADEGAGIDGDKRDRIFDPFFTTKEVGKGTGLGLAAAYGIVRNHHGHIVVRAREAGGTTFTVHLPLTTDPLREEHPPICPVPTPGEETILLIDDEPVVLQVGAAMLGHLGYTVLQAKGGEEALRLFEAKQQEIDLVILDMVMPSMMGSEVLSRLRQLDDQVKVLLSSGYGARGRARELMDRGCDGFLHKPFDLGDLSSKVRSLLDSGGRDKG